MRQVFAIGLSLLLTATGCAGTRVVRLDTGQGRPLEYRPPRGDRSVKVDEDAFKEALTRLVVELPLFIRPAEAGWLVRASTRGSSVDTALRSALRKSYGRWCQAHEAGGDCLSLLEDGLHFSPMHKLTLALGLSLDPMHESIADAVEDTVNPQLFYAVVVTGLVSWVALAANPEPVFTKVAAVLAAVLVVYLGVDAFLALVSACFELKQSADRATTFQELEEAGERFGKVLGAEGARVFVLAMTALLTRGVTAGTTWLASRLPLLPSFAEATALGASQVGLNLAAVEGVSAVGVVKGQLSIILAPNALAMAARGPGGGVRTEDHHLATIRNEISTARGGPWTPRFRDLFKKAGMKLGDPENIVPVAGHKGPHPQRYHERIYERLEVATRHCQGFEQCRKVLTRELERLAREASTPGSTLNRLLTQRE
ncbi:AHH domain-containing protein [Pyxidicoccus trucidator]|uniref:AHH domain-containing protein n=1 Tax=Pyxidicoccus trucidator TaxID=2709662 RepID=UPI0013DB4F79|nr:AHH domain-containing protein [Pyxidicoccus trucidator]